MERSICSNTELQEAVLAELLWEPSVDARHVGVAANGGIVTLNGRVETYAEKHAAEDAARRTRGVHAVVLEIDVHLAFEAKRGDDVIAAAVVDRLAWDTCIPTEAVGVTVENGWVTLTGVVDYFFQRNAAAQDVQRMLGVTGVSNQITLKPRVEVAHVQRDIMHALERSWSDPRRIVVTADGGTIRLSGTARTPHDRQTAATTAWSAPGATAVENDITIQL
jgi:osmotically-inducible protein OsmY